MNSYDHYAAEASDLLTRFETVCITTPLSVEEEREAVLRYKAGDLTARDLLIERNVRFIARECMKRAHYAVEFSDLFSSALEGFLVGLDRFDPDSGNRLLSYAVHWIRQRIFEHLGERAWVVRRPSHISNLCRNAIKGERLAEQRLGRAATVAEVADAACLRVDQVVEGMGAIGEVRLDEPTGYDDGTLADYFSDGHSHDQQVQEIEDNRTAQLIRDSLDILRPRYRKVLSKYFGFEGEPMILEDIGKEMGVTRERVRQIKALALAEIANYLHPRVSPDVRTRALPPRRRDQILRMVAEGDDLDVIELGTGVSQEAIRDILAA